MSDETEKRLAKIEANQDLMIKQFDNHLTHHFRYTLMAWSATVGLIVTLITLVLRG